MTTHEFGAYNSYSIPEYISSKGSRMEYGFVKAEKKRKWDTADVKKVFPHTWFKQFDDTGHGGLAVLKPETLADETRRIAVRVGNHRGASKGDMDTNTGG